MDQDIHFQKTIAMAAAAAVTAYMVLPYRCTLRALSGLANASMVAGQTVTVTYGATNTAATAIGVMTFPTAAGVKGVFVKNATTGSTVMVKVASLSL